MPQSQNIEVLGISVRVTKFHTDDFVSLTDIAKWKNMLAPKSVVANWLRLHNTIEYLGLWESINNQDFNRIEFDAFKNEAGTNAFTLSPSQWIEKTNAIGLTSRAGKYGGGTFAHRDIAIKFASWISVEFELYLIKEFQRLKETELKAMDWNTKRFLTKVNYKIHTDAIKSTLIPKLLDSNEIKYIYADEADILNMALFGQTAKEWRDKNPGVPGNMRDEATISQLIVLANLESINAEFIKMNMEQSQRLTLLNQIAIDQMKSLESMENIKSLGSKS